MFAQRYDASIQVVIGLWRWGFFSVFLLENMENSFYDEKKTHPTYSILVGSELRSSH